MAIHTITSVTIEDTAIGSLKRMVIQQDIDSHHFVELVCRMDAIDDPSQELAATSKNLIGGIISINIETDNTLQNYGTQQFKGIVTKLKTRSASEQNDGEDLLIIEAKSCSIIADDGLHNFSYEETDLANILTTTFQNYDSSKLEVINNPRFADNIHYCVQQEESAYQFASRLASQYGDWFYYNGAALVFGEDNSSEQITLTYGIDLKNISLELNPSPNNFKYYTNDYLIEDLHEKSSSEISDNTSGFNSFISSKSNEIYANQTNVFVNTFNDTTHRQRFDKLTEIETKSNTSKDVLVKGLCDNPGVKIGSIINIEGVAQGSYRVIKVRHITQENGDYENTFEAISADVEINPNTSIHAFPKSESQIAKVIDNVDPEGISRIKVQFPWQASLNLTTPWLRVLTPSSGADKGFHFIPEIDDEVLIGFEGGNAERPYVLGSLYTGNNKAEEWQTDANNIKAIRTRSGHTIELNDTEGEEKIQIYDNEGSIIIFDTQAKSLTINATEDIEIGAKNIRIVAEENIDIQAQGDITKAAQGNVTIQSQGNTDIQATGDASLASSANVSVEGTAQATLKGANLVAEGTAQTTLKGQMTKVQGQMTTIQGASGKTDYM